MERISDHPDLLPRLGAIQRDLVAQMHRLARTAIAIQELPRGRSLTEALSLILRAACENLGFQRAYAYVADGEALDLRVAWPQGRRSAGWLERRAIACNAPQASRSGKAVVVPLPPAGRVTGALRLEGRAPGPLAGDAIAPIMRFAEAAALALENANLADQVRSQGTQIQSLSSRLAEANHRINNNLQALAGFLAEHARAKDAAPGAGSQALRDGIGRIKTIAALHEALSCSHDDHPDLGRLTERVCAQTAAVDQDQERITVTVAADAVPADPGLCRAYALVLHELVSNALHHAYADGGQGEVRVSLRRADRGVTLVVADDGVGLEASAVPAGDAKRGGLGLHIAAAIVEHELRGGLQLSSANGTIARLEFTLPGVP
ncbi:MAG TPA: sensor histidine kinase [Armatimonadota bacterium]|nr:sensor histidine kinase [Armatimonadota bacterium]